MDTRIEVTHADLIAALTDQPGEDCIDALTALEIKERLGIGHEKTRNKIRSLVMGGKLECVRVRRVDISGRVQMVPAYRLCA
jgi:hypothetical protein